MPSVFTARHRERIVAQAARHRVPAVYPLAHFVEIGGLLSYGIDYADQFKRAAAYADRILKGAKPGELPVEQPDGITSAHRQLLIELAAKLSLPAFYPFRFFITDGGLMAYGVNVVDRSAGPGAPPI